MVLAVFTDVSNFFDVQGQCKKRDINAILEDLADTSMNGSIEGTALSREGARSGPRPPRHLVAVIVGAKGLLRKECLETISVR